MVKVLLLGIAALLPACGGGSSGGTKGSSDTMTSGDAMSTLKATTNSMTSPSFRPVAEMPFGAGQSPMMYVSLAVPVRRPAGLHLALFGIMEGPGSSPNIPREQRERELHSVPVPDMIFFLDARTHVVENPMPGYLNERRASHFGIPDPPELLLGRWDDPKWPSKERRDLLRARIFAAMDVLLPLFDNPSLPWTEQANLAAREVRDFFPVAAEPGLWPYYKAEGKDFFAWVEKNAPPGKVPLPWESVHP